MYLIYPNNVSKFFGYPINVDNLSRLSQQHEKVILVIQKTWISYLFYQNHLENISAVSKQFFKIPKLFKSFLYVVFIIRIVVIWIIS